MQFIALDCCISGEPKTGRMHQIRVHLQWLGHPIVNDPIYNHPAWRQPPDSLGTGTTNIERIISEIVRTNYSSEAPERATQTEISSAEDTVESHSVQKCKVSVTDLEISHDGQITRFSHNQQGSASGASLNSARDAEGSPNKSVAVDGGRDNEATEEQTDTEASVAPTSTCAAVGSTQTDSSEDADCSECHMFRPDPSPSDLLMYLHALSYKVGSYTGMYTYFIAIPILCPHSADTQITHHVQSCLSISPHNLCD